MAGKHTEEFPGRRRDLTAICCCALRFLLLRQREAAGLPRLGRRAHLLRHQPPGDPGQRHQEGEGRFSHIVFLCFEAAPPPASSRRLGGSLLFHASTAPRAAPSFISAERLQILDPARILGGEMKEGEAAVGEYQIGTD